MLVFSNNLNTSSNQCRISAPSLLVANDGIYRLAPQPGVTTLKPDLGPALIYKPATRPPLAGPYGFSRIPKPVWNKPRVHLVHDLAQTWLFSNLSSGYEIRII